MYIGEEKISWTFTIWQYKPHPRLWTPDPGPRISQFSQRACAGHLVYSTKTKEQIRTEQTYTFLLSNDVKVMLCHLFKTLKNMSIEYRYQLIRTKWNFFMERKLLYQQMVKYLFYFKNKYQSFRQLRRCLHYVNH